MKSEIDWLAFQAQLAGCFQDKWRQSKHGTVLVPSKEVVRVNEIVAMSAVLTPEDEDDRERLAMSGSSAAYWEAAEDGPDYFHSGGFGRDSGSDWRVWFTETCTGQWAEDSVEVLWWSYDSEPVDSQSVPVPASSCYGEPNFYLDVNTARDGMTYVHFDAAGSPLDAWDFDNVFVALTSSAPELLTDVVKATLAGKLWPWGMTHVPDAFSFWSPAFTAEFDDWFKSFLWKMANDNWKDSYETVGAELEASSEQRKAAFEEYWKAARR